MNIDMKTGNLSSNEGGNRRKSKSRPEEQSSAHEGASNPHMLGADNSEDGQSGTEGEDEARRHVRPVRRKYNIFRQTRPRGSNPDRAVALVRHFDR